MGNNVTVNRCPGCGQTYDDPDYVCTGGTIDDLASPRPHEPLELEQVKASVPDADELPAPTSTSQEAI